MRSTLFGYAAAMVFIGRILLADEPKTPDQEFEALVKEQRDAQLAFSRAYQAAQTKEEKDRVAKELGGSSPQHHSAAFARLIEKYPGDPVAIKALEWLFQRDPGGQATTAAIRALDDDLIKSPAMVQLCWIMGSRSGQNSETLLQALIAKSPHREVQAHALYARCLSMKSVVDRPQRNLASAAATQQRLEELLTEVIDKYGDVKSLHSQETLKQSAAAQLFELRFLSVGSPAPHVIGEDLDGKSMKLSDFQGNVVVLVFWGTWCGPCMAAVPEHQAMLEKHAGKPLVIVGVNGGDDRATARSVGAEKGIAWRSWWDGDTTHGPIVSQWNVQRWPTIYLIDGKGSIRYKGDILRSVSARRNVSGQLERFSYLDDYTDQLLKELETRK
jgi:thiol-disulfide isomerase/thioredoxin